MKPNKLTLVSFAFFILIIYSSKLATAQEGSSSSNVDSDAVQESIKKRIQQAVQNNQSDLAIDANTPIGWIGTLESLTDQSITISVNGLSQQVSISASTIILDEDEESLNLEDLEINNAIVAIGMVDDNNILNATKILTSEQLPKKPQKVSILGRIESIITRQRSFNIIPLGKTEILTMTYSSTTNYTQGFSEQQSLAIADFDESDMVIAIYEPDDDDIDQLNLLTLHLIESASPSATPVSTKNPTILETP